MTHKEIPKLRKPRSLRTRYGSYGPNLTATFDYSPCLYEVRLNLVGAKRLHRWLERAIKWMENGVEDD